MIRSSWHTDDTRDFCVYILEYNCFLAAKKQKIQFYSFLMIKKRQKTKSYRPRPDAQVRHVHHQNAVNRLHSKQTLKTFAVIRCILKVPSQLGQLMYEIHWTPDGDLVQRYIPTSGALKTPLAPPLALSASAALCSSPNSLQINMAYRMHA